MTDTPQAPRPATAFADLGEPFADPVAPASFPKQIVRFRNQRWADRVGLGGLDEAGWRTHFASFTPLKGGQAEPLAVRYHGHQFQVYNPDLGDGRGFLYAQLHDLADGRLLDFGTKGSGQTPYSRAGDGRLTLKGGVREALATEMLEALGVYTSKTFSLIETGEQLYRGDEPSPTRSCVMVRLSHSHVRFGAFQRLAFHQDPEAIGRLVAYCLESLLAGEPEAAAARAPNADAAEKAGAFLAIVSRRAARLAASWMAAGFVHGVLNTDNMNVTGESFDYGPYRFAPSADPEFTAAYFDHGGLYAYGRQPDAVAWNLSRLAGALLGVASEEKLTDALGGFAEEYRQALLAALLARLGLKSGAATRPEDEEALPGAALGFLQSADMPFEWLFFDWFCGGESQARAARSPHAALYQSEAFASLRALLDRFEPDRPERLANGYFAKDAPTTLLIDEIEAIWERIAADDDWAPFEAKIAEARAFGEVLGLRPVSAPAEHRPIGG
ncbi:MAG: YdiU family protein [Pseudomonadota bacterium]